MQAPIVRRTALVGALAVLLALAVTASAVAAAPSATTGPTTAVGSTSATVTGTVDPGGQSTTWYVEYGKSTSYGSKTASASAGSGSSATTSPPTCRASTPARPTTTASWRRTQPARSRRRRCFHDHRPSGREHRQRLEHRGDERDAERDRRPERPRHCLLLRVRHDVELRHEDVVEERRLVDEPAVGIRVDHGPAGRPHLSLPSRRLERRGHEHRQGRDLRHERSAFGGDRRCDVARADERDPHRVRHAERPRDDVVVRVRHLHRLRIQDRLAQRRLRFERRQGLARREEPQGGHDLPLPPRRPELDGQDGGRRPFVLDHRRAGFPDGRRAERRAGLRSRLGLARHARAARRPGGSSTGRRRATATRRRRRTPSRRPAPRASARP